MHLQFIVTRNYYNNVVRIEGLKEPPTAPAAVAALRLTLGEPFRESALREAIVRLQDALRAEGLYVARVSSSLEPHEDTRQMDITLHVDPGPRARVGGFVFQNQTPYQAGELLHRSRMKSKVEMTAARLTRSSQRLKKFLVNQGYLGAGVVITTGTYDPASNLVPLTLRSDGRPTRSN